jgi:hypothetical protein
MAEEEIGRPIDIYVVDDSTAEMFCLSGFQRLPIVMTERYRSLLAIWRRFVADDRLEALLPELSERMFLKTVAELSIRDGQAELAILAFVKSCIGKSLWLDEDVEQYKLTSASENQFAAYAISAFYPILHEAGHLLGTRAKDSTELIWPDSYLVEWIARRYDDFFPQKNLQERKASVLDRAESDRTSFILGIDRIRVEAAADIFACVILLNFVGSRQMGMEAGFDYKTFAREFLQCMNSVSTVERCRSVAKLTASGNVNVDDYLDSLLYPIANAARFAGSNR